MTDSPLQFSPKVVLVTGGAGFIGTNFVRLVLQSAEAKVVVFDSLTYAGNLPNLDGLAEDYKDRFVFVEGDICDAKLVSETMEKECVDSFQDQFSKNSVHDRARLGSRPDSLGTTELFA